MVYLYMVLPLVVPAIACMSDKFGSNCNYDVCTNCTSVLLPGVAAQYFTDDGFHQISPLYQSYDRAVDFYWEGGGPKPGVSGDNFRVVWTGFVSTTQPGRYSFRCQTNADNEFCRFWLDGVEVMPENPITLADSTPVRLKVVYEDHSGGANCSLQWSTYNLEYVPIPDGNLMRKAFCQTCNNRGGCVADGICRCNPGYTGFDCSIELALLGNAGTIRSGGLRASYACCDTTFTSLFFNPDAYNYSEIVPTIDANWTSGGPFGLPGNGFMVRYEGFLTPPNTGWYTLRVTTDGDDEGARIYLDKVIIFTWAKSFTQDVYLRADVTHELVVEYYNRWEGAQVHLMWASAQNTTFSTIPSSNLFYYNSNITSSCPQNGLQCTGPHASFGCYNYVCQCRGGFYSPDCSMNTCAWQNDKCLLTDICHQGDQGSTVGICGDHGTCFDGICQCEGPFTSASQCFLSDGCPGNRLCSGRGRCSSYSCMCDFGYFGNDCQYDLCNPSRAYLPGLTAEYHTDGGFNTPVALFRSAVRHVNASWGKSGPLPEVSGDKFRVIYTGFVRAYTPGMYTFECTIANSDECRFWIDGKENTIANLSENSNVRIKIVYEHKWLDAAVHFQWKLPGALEFVTVPEESFVREVYCPTNCSDNGCCVGDGICRCALGFAGADCSQSMDTCVNGSGFSRTMQNGLRVSYSQVSPSFLFFNPMDLQTSYVVPNVDVDWGDSTGPLYGDNFMVRYEGYLQPQYTGWHVLSVTTSGTQEAARLFIDKVEVFGWTPQFSAEVHLLKNTQHEIVVEYYDLSGDAQIHLYWSSENFNTRLIQSKDLYYRSSGAVCSCPINRSPHNGLTCSGPVNSLGCYNGMCQCRGGYYGVDCSLYACPNDACLLTDACHHALVGSSEGVCGGNGVCDNGGCNCLSNYSAASQCTIPNSCPGNGKCSSVGTCNNINSCTCDNSHFGSDCQFNKCDDRSAFVPGLTAEYYTFDGSSGLPVKLYRAFDSSIDLSMGGGGMKPLQSGKVYQTVWMGYVRPFASGNYLFSYPTNGVNEFFYQVWINGTKISNRTGVNLVQNINVRIKVVLQANLEDAAAAYLHWQPPDGALEAVPAEQLVRQVYCPAGCSNQGCCVADGICRCNPGFFGPDCSVSTCSGKAPVAAPGGLRATYYCCDQNVNSLFFNRSISNLTEIVPTVDANWGEAGPMNLSGDGFMVRYEGMISPDFTDWYTIQATTNDSNEGVRVFVDKTVVFGWTTGFSQKVHLMKSVLHEIVVEYYDLSGKAEVHLSWVSSNFVSHIIPTKNLYYMSNSGVCSCPVNPSNGMVCSGPLNSFGCYNGYCQCLGTFSGSDCSQQACADNLCLINDMCYHEGRGSSDGQCAGNEVCKNGTCSGLSNNTDNNNTNVPALPCNQTDSCSKNVSFSASANTTSINVSGVRVVVQPDPVWGLNGTLSIAVNPPSPATASQIVSINFFDASNNPRNIRGLSNPVQFFIPLLPGVATPFQACVREVPVAVIPACNWFDTVDSAWKTSGCVTTLFPDQVECNCTHLTDFAAVFPQSNPIPLNQALYLTADNIALHPDGIITIGIVFAIFVPLIIMAVYRDKHEKQAEEILQTQKFDKWTKAAASQAQINFKTRWCKEFRDGIQLRHTWGSLIFRKSGTTFRSVDRTFVCLFMVLVLMSMSASFHERHRSFVSRAEVTVLNILVSLPLGLLLTHLFTHTGEMGFYEKWRIQNGMMQPSKIRCLRHRFDERWRYVWYALVLLSVIGMIIYILSIALMFDQNPEYYCRGKTTLVWIIDFIIPYAISICVVEPVKIMLLLTSRSVLQNQRTKARLNEESAGNRDLHSGSATEMDIFPDAASESQTS